MTRDEAIEAGARNMAPRHTGIPWEDMVMGAREEWRRDAAAVLDAIGWAEPVGWVVYVPAAGHLSAQVLGLDHHTRQAAEDHAKVLNDRGLAAKVGVGAVVPVEVAA